MTRTEQTNLMGDAAAELAAVRRLIGCLETKAEAYRRIITQASQALGDGADEGFPDASQWPSIADLEKLRDELNEAQTRRHQLTTRMREWGVIE